MCKATSIYCVGFLCITFIYLFFFLAGPLPIYFVSQVEKYAGVVIPSLYHLGLVSVLVIQACVVLWSYHCV